jgi:hypothetical protein
MEETEGTKPIELNGADAWHLSRVVKHTWTDHYGREIGRELLDKIIEAILHFEDEGSHVAEKIYLSEPELWAIHFLVQDTSFPGAKGLLMQVFRALWEIKNERRWMPVGPADRAREVEARRRLVQLRQQMLLQGPEGQAPEERAATEGEPPTLGAD